MIVAPTQKSTMNIANLGSLFANAGGGGNNSTASNSAANTSRNMTTLNNIERLLHDSSTLKHKKTLQNILSLVKGAELVEDYRNVVGFLQRNCGCKKSKFLQDQLSGLEKRYQEYSSSTNSSPVPQNSEFCNRILVDTQHGIPAQIITTAGAISPLAVGPNNKVVVTPKFINQAGKTVAYTMATPAITTNPKSPVLNFAVFNQTLKNNNDSQVKALISNLTTANNNNNLVNNNNNKNSSFVSRNNGNFKTYSRAGNNINTQPQPPPETVTIMDDDEDQPDEEYDIAEYIVLAEMLEREKGKLSRERDPKNEFIFGE